MYSDSGGINLWRGNQLAHARSRVVDCGDANLARELPGGGWPRGALTDLLVQQTGCGELRLLRPAFERLSSRPVAMLQPPHDLQPTALAWWGLDPSSVMTVKAPRTADALWAAEQILRAGTCGALLFWQNHVRPESLRRLQTDESGEAEAIILQPWEVVRVHLAAEEIRAPGGAGSAGGLRRG